MAITTLHPTALPGKTYSFIAKSASLVITPDPAIITFSVPAAQVNRTLFPEPAVITFSVPRIAIPGISSVSVQLTIAFSSTLTTPQPIHRKVGIHFTTDIDGHSHFLSESVALETSFNILAQSQAYEHINFDFVTSFSVVEIVRLHETINLGFTTDFIVHPSIQAGLVDFNTVMNFNIHYQNVQTINFAFVTIITPGLVVEDSITFDFTTGIEAGQGQQSDFDFAMTFAVTGIEDHVITIPFTMGFTVVWGRDGGPTQGIAFDMGISVTGWVPSNIRQEGYGSGIDDPIDDPETGEPTHAAPPSDLI